MATRIHVSLAQSVESRCVESIAEYHEAHSQETKADSRQGQVQLLPVPEQVVQSQEERPKQQGRRSVDPLQCHDRWSLAQFGQTGSKGPQPSLLGEHGSTGYYWINSIESQRKDGPEDGTHPPGDEESLVPFFIHRRSSSLR